MQYRRFGGLDWKSSALHELKWEKVPTRALAEQACHIEMDLGHPVGKHDHYLAALRAWTFSRMTGYTSAR